MTIDEIRKAAVHAAYEQEIDWDALSDEMYRTDFLTTLNTARAISPVVESLYTKLMANESVAFDGEPSPLPFDEVETYRLKVAEALFENIFLCEVYHKYEMVEKVMSAAYPLDNPPETE